MKYSNYFEKITQASSLSDNGKSSDAIKTYLDAIELSPETSDKLEPLYALGLEFKNDSPEESITYFEQCSKIAKTYKNSFYYSYFYNSERELGELYMQLKRFPKSLLHFKKAYKEIKKMDDDPDTEDYLEDLIKAMEKRSA